jgi:hypothetical protein
MARQMGVAWTTRRPRMHAVRSLRWDVKWESAGNLEHASSSVCSFLEVLLGNDCRNRDTPTGTCRLGDIAG